MKFDLKKFLKTLKLNESSISMVLGAIVIIVTGILVVNYFKDRGGQVGETGSSTEQTGISKTHTVTKGESLWLIAQNEIGSGYNWVDIAKANNLTQPGTISEGQKLVIPAVTPIKIGEAKAATSITGATYEVAKGDNLWTISVRAYGDGYKWTKIAQENKLTNPGIIHPGNILVLPR